MTGIVDKEWILRVLSDLQNAIEREQATGVIDMGAIKLQIQDIIDCIQG